jgi:hypothetical protein
MIFSSLGFSNSLSNEISPYLPPPPGITSMVLFLKDSMAGAIF